MSIDKNKIMIYIALIALILATIISSVLQANNRHKDNLYKSMNLKVIEAAKKCINDEICVGEKVFVKELYDNKYLEEVTNPYTKKTLNENSYFYIHTKSYKLY